MCSAGPISQSAPRPPDRDAGACSRCRGLRACPGRLHGGGGGGAMDSPEVTFTLAYLVFAVCFVFTPTEFYSAGLTVQNLLSGWLGSEDAAFVSYHLRRTAATLLCHSLLPLGEPAAARSGPRPVGRVGEGARGEAAGPEREAAPPAGRSQGAEALARTPEAPGRRGGPAPGLGRGQGRQRWVTLGGVVTGAEAGEGVSEAGTLPGCLGAVLGSAPGARWPLGGRPVTGWTGTGWRVGGRRGSGGPAGRSRCGRVAAWPRLRLCGHGGVSSWRRMQQPGRCGERPEGPGACGEGGRRGAHVRMETGPARRAGGHVPWADWLLCLVLGSPPGSFSLRTQHPVSRAAS